MRGLVARFGWRPLFLAGALAFAIVALLPLRIALDRLGAGARGLSAREAEGSVWLGLLRGARIGPAPLGDVSARLRILPLLAGRARVDLARADGSFSAGLSLARHGGGIDDAKGSLEAGLAAPLPPLRLSLADVTIRFRDGLCEHAEGRVTAQVAGLPVALSGEARCEGPALLLPLGGPGGRLGFRLWANGRYSAEMALAAAPELPARIDGSF